MGPVLYRVFRMEQEGVYLKLKKIKCATKNVSCIYQYTSIPVLKNNTTFIDDPDILALDEHEDAAGKFAELLIKIPNANTEKYMGITLYARNKIQENLKAF